MNHAVDDGLKFIKRFNNPYLTATRLGTPGQTWGIEAMPALLAQLGNPHLKVPCIHIAGTKGKGSTAALITHALSAAGLKVGLYTTPHLQTWNERMQINRIPIGQERLTSLVQSALTMVDIDDNDTLLTEYELATALAFLYFAQEDCDIAVIEVGLGGTVDATNVVQPLVSIISRISYDHMQFLGDTLTEIASNKAGIIKENTPTVSVEQMPEAMAVIKQTASERNSHLTVLGEDWFFDPVGGLVEQLRVRIGRSFSSMDTYEIGLSGLFQYENAALATAALDVVKNTGFDIPLDAVKTGFAEARWEGRFEVIQQRPLTIIDGAHNVDSMNQLMTSLDILTAIPYEKRTVIFGCMADKDVNGLLDVVMKHACNIIFTEFNHSRASSAEDLYQAALSRPDGDKPHLLVKTNIREAFLTAFDYLQPLDLLVATGSLSLVGAVRTYWNL